MKLLFDENLAPKLAVVLAEVYPNSAHVRTVGLKSSPDREVWDYAASNDFVIVSKDADFRQRSFLYGHPPKVIWIRAGNCSTERIAMLLRDHVEEIQEFAASNDAAFLSLE